MRISPKFPLHHQNPGKMDKRDKGLYVEFPSLGRNRDYIQNGISDTGEALILGHVLIREDLLLLVSEQDICVAEVKWEATNDHICLNEISSIIYWKRLLDE